MIGFFKKTWTWLTNYRLTGGKIVLIALASVAVFSIAVVLEFSINASKRRIDQLEKAVFALDTETQTLAIELSSLTTVERVRAKADKFLPHYKTMTKADILRRGRDGAY